MYLVFLYQIVACLLFHHHSVVLEIVKPDFVPYCTTRDKCKPACSCEMASNCSLLDLDDTLRKNILSYHNQIRDIQSAGEPIPGGMTMLEYDDQLEQISRCWVARCDNEYSECFTTSKFAETSQSVVQVVLEEGQTPQLSQWMQMMNFWLGQAKSISAETLSDLPAGEEGENIHNFAQLLSDHVLFVGCAWSIKNEGSKDSDTELTFVCTYGPRGPLKGEPVYRIGHQCTLCPTNYACDHEKPFARLCKATANVSSVILPPPSLPPYPPQTPMTVPPVPPPRPPKPTCTTPPGPQPRPPPVQMSPVYASIKPPQGLPIMAATPPMPPVIPRVKLQDAPPQLPPHIPSTVPQFVTPLQLPPMPRQAALQSIQSLQLPAEQCALISSQLPAQIIISTQTAPAQVLQQPLPSIQVQAPQPSPLIQPPPQISAIRFAPQVIPVMQTPLQTMMPFQTPPQMPPIQTLPQTIPPQFPPKPLQIPPKLPPIPPPALTHATPSTHIIFPPSPPMPPPLPHPQPPPLPHLPPPPPPLPHWPPHPTSPPASITPPQPPPIHTEITSIPYPRPPLLPKIPNQMVPHSFPPPPPRMPPIQIE